MLFLVPDANDPPETAGNQDTAATTKLAGNVELDLDDAPFLQEPEPEPEPQPKQEKAPQPAVAMPAPQPEKKSRFSKKLVLMAGGGTVFLILALVAVNFFLFPSKKPPEEAQQAASAEPRKITVPSTPPEKAAPALPQFITKWDPFIVPMKGPEGEVVLFNITLSVPTDSPALNAELEQRKVLLRDAVYYYLSKRALDDLMNKDLAMTLRTDIVRVLNENLTSGKVESIFVEDFFSEHL